MKKNSYKNGKEHGYWELTFMGGNISVALNYMNGLRHGSIIDYYYDGRVNYTGQYSYNVKCGYWETYLSNGDLFLKEYNI